MAPCYFVQILGTKPAPNRSFPSTSYINHLKYIQKKLVWSWILFTLYTSFKCIHKKQLGSTHYHKVKEVWGYNPGGFWAPFRTPASTPAFFFSRKKNRGITSQHCQWSHWLVCDAISRLLHRRAYHRKCPTHCLYARGELLSGDFEWEKTDLFTFAHSQKSHLQWTTIVPSTKP